ncbi:endonuclease/exonuclease/phosphatase family metal-dependent hydrolase [Pontibacter aydingkolensis]|uniref:T9SS type A sorting domain-containing protein n=1 Tax=Pontibacter aydingkolensis TaxID=1911536 RepID=A0ABS7CRE0_9BACT|nr:endonuclease/exonuclease/phosphatase family protein [Pontibacter aydingkolensis]MBW7466390.1 T9SS type A sorting domain-containing protein [Pontibacter aydingkolensis]
MTKQLQKLTALVLVCCAFLGSSNAWGQINLQQSPYTENFDNLSSGFPSGWTALRYAGTGSAGAVLSPVDTDGSASSGGIYSAGAGTDRALGTLASSTTIPAMGAAFTNNTGSTLNLIKISAVMEQWRSGSRNDHDEVVKFEYSLNAIALNDANATWTAVSSLDLNEILKSSTSAGPVNGNADANKTNIAADLTALNWANGSNLWIRWVDTDNVGSDGIYAIDDFKIEFASNSTAPSIFIPSSLNLGETLVGNPVVADYTLSTSNLTANLNITSQAPFEVSRSATSGFATAIAFTPAELASNPKVYVRVTPTTAGVISGTILHTSTGATDTELSVSVLTFSPYVQDFNNCVNGADIVGGWMQYSVTGAQTWACTTFGRDGNGVQMNGYTNTSNENEDWLVSPAMDFSAFSIPLMSVDYRTKFSGAGLVIKVSTNYSGSGNPAAATWTDLLTLPANNVDAWETLANLSLAAYKSANTYIAFVYTSTTTASARWTLDNFEVQNVENFVTTDLVKLSFAETAVGNTTAAQQFTFQAGGFTEDVIVAAPANFELSKDGTAFATALTYTPAEAAGNNTVYVRFKPLTAVAMNAGPVSFTSGTSPSVARGQLSGSSILKAKTLDVVTWNIEWFGSTSSGPTNEDLQYENAKKVIQDLNADIIGVQEIVDENKLRALATEIGYAYESMTMSWQASSEQKVAFLYKPEVVTVKKEKVILSKLYEDIRAGRTTLTDYPGSSSLLWASGRLPYMVQFEADIDGVKQLYNVVNIHAKANTTNPTEDYNRRVYDARVLKDSLNAQYANTNLIILGDYNDDVDVSVVGTNQPSSFNTFVSDNNFITLTYSLSLTGAATYESGSFNSFLDHLIINKALEDEYIANSTMIESQLLESVANFRTTTSDHLPVSARFYLSTDNTTGIADATKGQFKVYPNPTANYVNLVLPDRATKGNVHLSVWSVDGRRVFETSGNLHDANQNLNSKVSSLAKGVYIIKIHAGNEVYQSRLMKN